MNIKQYSEPALECLFKHVSSVTIATIDRNGHLIDGNVGFRLLAGLEPDTSGNIADRFIQPLFRELTAIKPSDGGTLLYQGTLTLGSDKTGDISLNGSFHGLGDYYLFVAEHNDTNLEQINTTIVQLNRKLEQREKKISELMLTDELTTLPNRRYLEQYLEQEFARSDRNDHPLSLALVDIDRFKRVNDQLGYDSGDRLLRQFAQSLKTAVRTGDFVARLGGEEFIIVYPNTDLDQAMEVSERVRNRISTKRDKQIPWEITSSFGVAERRPQEPGQHLIKHADIALYRAKQTGCNNVIAYIPGEFPEPKSN